MAVAIPTLDLDHPSTPLPDRLSTRPDFPSMYVVDEEVDALVRDLSRERTYSGMAIVGAAARSLSLRGTARSAASTGSRKHRPV